VGGCAKEYIDGVGFCRGLVLCSLGVRLLKAIELLDFGLSLLKRS